MISVPVLSHKTASLLDMPKAFKKVPYKKERKKRLFGIR
jgi:hypothetical protein